jgi:tungstate transport system substrate-binding protein
MIDFKPPRGLSLAPRRALALACAACLCLFALPAGAAQADSPTSLTVVGTSDVSDSGLSPNVILPQFHAAYPQFVYKYIGTATGTAITNAETGSVGASVLIVHAASLENQFVAGGYSYEQYGRAIFTNDFILAGPSGDPAGVAGNAGSNIVQAFEDIATAGINGGGTPKVTFVSRGGTPGTTVEEHQIWALVASNNPPAGLLLCAVSAANGGGDTPIASGNGVTANGQPCPNSGALPTAGQLPTWYVATGLTQGPNVVAANACTGYQSPANTCYVLTDRGTYDYLISGVDPAGTIGLANLTHGPQSATAPGGANLLVNYFHAYIINPAKPNEAVNLPAAQHFVDLLTSPSFQSQLKYYLNATSDRLGAPFVADASPMLTASALPSTDKAGKAVTVTGTLSNVEPGYPALAGKTVSVDEIVAGIPVPVGSGTTTPTGTYSISFVPKATGDYEVATVPIAQIESGTTLSPPFGDLLSPAATNPVQMTVSAPPSGPSASSVSLKNATVKKGRLTVSGTVRPAPTASGAQVELLAVHGTGGGRLKEIAHTSVGKGKTTFAIKAKLKRGSRYALQLEYVQKDQPAAFSRLSSIDVH